MKQPQSMNQNATTDATTYPRRPRLEEIINYRRPQAEPATVPQGQGAERRGSLTTDLREIEQDSRRRELAHRLRKIERELLGAMWEIRAVSLPARCTWDLQGAHELVGRVLKEVEQ